MGSTVLNPLVYWHLHFWGWIKFLEECSRSAPLKSRSICMFTPCNVHSQRNQQFDFESITQVCLCLQAHQFQSTGRQIRRKMWWNNVKIKIFLAVLVLVIVLIIFLSVCFSGGNCFKWNSWLMFLSHQEREFSPNRLISLCTTSPTYIWWGWTAL